MMNFPKRHEIRFFHPAVWLCVLSLLGGGGHAFAFPPGERAFEPDFSCRWLLLIGIGIGTLLLLAKALSRRRAELFLRSAENHYAAFFRSNLVGMTAVTTEGEWLEFNDKFCEILGYSRAELERKSWVDLIHADDLAGVLEDFGALCSGEFETCSRRMRHRRRDGSICHLQVSSKALRHSKGQIDRIVNIVQDVTERQRFEEDLRLDEARLEALVALNRMADAPVEKIVNFVVASAIGLTRSQNGYLAFVNEAEGTLIKHGWSRGKIRDCSVEKHSAGYPIAEAGLWAEAVRHKKPIIINDYFSPKLVKKGCPEGHVGIERFVGVPLLDQDKVVAVIGVGNKPGKYDDADVRQLNLLGQGLLRLLESKRVEETLRESREEYKRLYQQFQTLLNGIPDGLFLLEPDMTIVWGNQGAADLMGVKVEELAGKVCFCLMAGRDGVCPDCPVVRCFQTGKPEEGLFTTANGRILGKKAFPLKDADGKVWNAIEMVVDITEKLRMRKETERAGRLASLGQLAAGVAHEINNPNGILMFNAKILSDFFTEILPCLPDFLRQQGLECPGGVEIDALDVEIPQLLGDMQESSRRIGRIVNDLKDFVRSESELTHGQIDLNEVVATTVRMAGNMIRKSTANFQVSQAAGLPWVRGNFQQLEQVIINLIVNACQALQDKNRGIYLATYFDEFKRQSIVEVRDEGEGIDPKALPHITEPFFTTKRKKGGTGLGLSVSTRIVREHRGQLNFLSNPGEGTTVRLALPCLAVEEAL